MKEEFVNYSEALALKKLGFNEPCFAMWTTGLSEFESSNVSPSRIFSSKFKLNDTQSCTSYINNLKYFGVSAPTFSQAFRWFRKEHKLESNIQRMPPEMYGKGKGYIKNYMLYIWAENLNPRGQQTLHFDTYEEAELECLKKLIEIVKNK